MKRFLSGLALSVPFLWTLLAVAVVAVGYLWLRPHTTPILPPDVQQRQDSLVATRPRAEYVIDSLRMVSVAAEERSRAAERRAQGTVATANTAKHRADSLALVAAQSKDAADSATHYREAYEQRTAEALGLRRTLVEDSTALAEERLAAAAARARADTADRRRVAIENQNLALDAAIKRAAKRDKLFGLIPLPSRTTSFLVGNLTGALLDEAAHTLIATRP